MDTHVNSEKVEAFINEEWDKLFPTFVKILEIPSQSRIFDPEQDKNALGIGFQPRIYKVKNQKINNKSKGFRYELLQDAGCQPFMFVEVKGSTPEDPTILFYGHMDKQPPFEGWREGLHPYKPKVVDGKLYGQYIYFFQILSLARGGADDHYSIFGSVLAVKACQVLGYKHPRIVMVFESDEESGSGDIHHYIEKLKDQIGKRITQRIIMLGNVDIVFCLDSGCGNYEQLWLTSTLRGMVAGVVNVKVLKEGVHSGDASGIVPSSFRIFRQLLDRLENSKTGEVVDDFQVVIPGESYLEAQKSAQCVAKEMVESFPFIDKMTPTSNDYFQCYLNRTWKAQLSIVGADGLPKADVAGNVLRPETKLKLSLRLPPTKDPKEAEEAFVRLLTQNVPYNATVEITQLRSAKGYKAPENAPYLTQILNESSIAYYKKEMLGIGEGGSIPLMNLLKDLQLIRYPASQFVVTGVLGPFSNAHGPNEMLDINYCKKLICCLSHTLGSILLHANK